MFLYYYKSKAGHANFGDDLNPWIWERLLPNLFNDDKNVGFIGIGTLLNDLIPVYDKTLVFSSGVGYGNNIPKIDKSWKFYCVRGPLSAKMLKLPDETAVTDGALLVKLLYNSNPVKKFRFSYMPHIAQDNQALKDLCFSIPNLNYISPGLPIEAILEQIACTEILVTEAMHGAIVADALRIPWIPVKTVSNILDFKWRDWCCSLNLDFKFNTMYPIWVNPNNKNLYFHLKNNIKERIVENQLKNILKNGKPQLSKENRHLKCLEELQIRLENFKRDWL